MTDVWKESATRGESRACVVYSWADLITSIGPFKAVNSVTVAATQECNSTGLLTGGLPA